MGINEPELVNLVNQIEELEQKIFAHPLRKVLLFFCRDCGIHLNKTPYVLFFGL